MYCVLFAVSVPTGWFVLGAIALALLAAYMLGGIWDRARNTVSPARSRSLQWLEKLAWIWSNSLTDAKVNRTGSFKVLS